MMVIGGRTNNVNERLPLEIFDSETSEWHAFDSVQRFRHGSWIQDKQLMIFGGFELSTPNVPTDSIYSLSLASLFEKNAALNAKLKSREDSVLYKGEPKSPSTPNTPNMRPSVNTPPSVEKPKPSTPKRRIPKIMEPAVVG